MRVLALQRLTIIVAIAPLLPVTLPLVLLQGQLDVCSRARIGTTVFSQMVPLLDELLMLRQM